MRSGRASRPGAWGFGVFFWLSVSLTGRASRPGSLPIDPCGLAPQVNQTDRQTGRQENPKPRQVIDLCGASGCVEINCWQRPTLPQRHHCSTISAEELNDRVRDGIGWVLFAITTSKLWCCVLPALSGPSAAGGRRENRTGQCLLSTSVTIFVKRWANTRHLSIKLVQSTLESKASKSKIKPLGRLVPLSSTCCHAST